MAPSPHWWWLPLMPFSLPALNCKELWRGGYGPCLTGLLLALMEAGRPSLTEHRRSGVCRSLWQEQQGICKQTSGFWSLQSSREQSLVSLPSFLSDSAFLNVRNAHFCAHAPFPVSVWQPPKAANSKINIFTCRSQCEMYCVCMPTKPKEREHSALLYLPSAKCQVGFSDL